MEPAPKPAKGGAKPAPAAAAAPADTASIEAAALDSIRAMMLIRTYRVRGHLAADLDPLGLARNDLPADLSPHYHGFTDADLDRPIFLGGQLGLERATVREIVAILRRNYCGHVGLEYMHIGDVEERKFLQERMEGHDKEIVFTPEGKKAILAKVIQGEQYEKFLGRKYVGTKRFGLDGGESALPALEAVIKYGGSAGVEEIVLGMPHRGRLNVLVNVMGKPYRAVFSEFAGGSANPEDIAGSGDVKYHLGTSTDREFEGVKVHMSLAANPSHLEAVDPVVLGKARAKQTRIKDNDRGKVLPILMHGDAAFAGQGIIMECFGFSGLRGYSTGGTIHFVVNNQIGFTTSPQFARSSPYSTDIAKMVSAPILHVNGDDPEAVTFACKLATDFRMTFKRDVVIDMWCYRRFGHNEGDEPGFTQPLMYDEIRKHPPVSAVYAERLKAEGVVDDAWVEAEAARYVAELEDEFEAGKSYRPNKADWFEGAWKGMTQAKEKGARSGMTAVTQDQVDKLVPILTEPPRLHRAQDAAAHPRGQEADVRVRRGLRLGDRRGAGVRHAAPGELRRPPVGPGFGPRHLLAAPRGVDRPAGRPQVYPALRGRSLVPGARQPALRVRRARLRIWLCVRRTAHAGDVGSAVRRFRQRRAGHHGPVHLLVGEQVAALQRARDAAAARLRGAGAGA